LPRTTGWMRVAEDRARWRTIREAWPLGITILDIGLTVDCGGLMIMTIIRRGNTNFSSAATYVLEAICR
jgi:hypothetical protein